MKNTTGMVLLPLSSVENFKRFLVGVIFFIFSEFILPFFFCMGYIIKVFRNVQEDKYELPKWEGWTKITLDGFFVSIISLIYFIPALLSLFIAVFLLVINSKILMLLFIILGILLFIMSAFLLPMSFSEYARTSDFFSSLNIFNIGKLVVGNLKNYISFFFILIVVSIPFGVVLGVTRLILNSLNVGELIRYLLLLPISSISQFAVLTIMAILFGSLQKKQLELTQEKPKETEKIKEVIFIRCPKCKTKNEEDATYCKKCRKKL